MSKTKMNSHNLFDPQDTSKMLERIERLKPDSPAQWGKMNSAQMLAHCNASFETAMGKKVFKWTLIGRILGTLMKRRILGEKQFDRNSPTDKSYIFPGNVGFAAEKEKIISSVRKFSEGGPAVCTVHPHPFFGKFTPAQWAVFEWKHLDHHLRQFGV
jgi:hypothetical protein